MPTRNTRTRIDDQRKDHIDLEGLTQGNHPNNYKPITCLPMMWIILTAQIRFTTRKWRGLFPEEQKGYRKGSRGTGKLLYINQHILNESKTRRKNLDMAWIDYKTAYDTVSQSWILNCLKMYEISDKVIHFIEKTMKTWEVELIPGERSLAEAKVQRQDALSSLLFIIAMMLLNDILRKCTAGYKLSKIARKDQSPDVHERHQTNCKKGKRTGNSNTRS